MASKRRQDAAIGEQARSATVSELLSEWQETGSHEVFESLVTAVRPRLMGFVVATLVGQGIKDPAAADDALALVLDHLRRLAGAGAEDRQVGRFSSSRSSRGRPDAGWGYLRQLARGRACDVARDRRRQGPVFSQLERHGRERFERAIAAAAGGGVAPPPLADRLRAAARSLEPRQRLLVEMLLDGKSQVVIAHVLEVSEGTVSRLRARALASLRRILGS